MGTEETVLLPDNTYKTIIDLGNEIYFGYGKTEEEAKEKARYVLELSKLPKRGPGAWEI